MHPRRRAAPLTIATSAVASLVVVAAACDSGGGGDGGAAPATTAAASAVTTVATPTTEPVDAEFCAAMVALDERTDTDAAEAGPEALQDVIDTYGELAPIAPADIAQELVAVRERMLALQSGDDLTDEQVAIADESALRVASWVDLNCRGVANNPGPPATPPP